MALVKTCPTCGVENLPTSPFCSQCGVSLVAIAPSEAVEPTVDAVGVRQFAEKAVCPDCKAENDARADRCIYCDGLLSSYCNTREGCTVELAWPWGKELLTQSLRIGREPPAPEGLIAAINAHGYDNISRSHAELRRVAPAGGALVVDLGSTNGTFVDGVRLPANKPTPLKSGTVVRFAANLSVTVTIGES
jgi:hypothetical protein